MTAMLKTAMFGGVFVLGLMAMECLAEQPSVPPPVPRPPQVAAYPCAWGYYGYGFPRLGYVPYQIPYFALHPPVYYSYPVPRPYGYSPFAYPPGVMTPEVAPPAPLVIRNKFVPSKKSASPDSGDRITQAPLRIVNPYVGQADGAPAAGHAVAMEAPRQPQVIYPMASAGELSGGNQSGQTPQKR